MLFPSSLNDGQAPRAGHFSSMWDSVNRNSSLPGPLLVGYSFVTFALRCESVPGQFCFLRPLSFHRCHIDHTVSMLSLTQYCLFPLHLSQTIPQPIQLTAPKQTFCSRGVLPWTEIEVIPLVLECIYNWDLQTWQLALGKIPH